MAVIEAAYVLRAVASLPEVSRCFAPYIEGTSCGSEEGVEAPTWRFQIDRVIVLKIAPSIHNKLYHTILAQLLATVI